MNSKSATLKLILSIGLTLAVAGVHAEKPSLIDQGVVYGEAVDTGYYPSKPIMNEIYWGLVSSGDLTNDDAIANPSEAVLQEAYRFAQESGRLEEHGYSLKGAETDLSEAIPMQDLMPDMSAKATLPEECRVAAQSCLGNVVGFGLACGAMLLPAIGWAEVAGCGLELANIVAEHAVQNCLSMRDKCPRVNTYASTATTTTAKGATSGKKYTFTCSGINRVNGVYGRYKDYAPTSSGVEYALTRLRLTCTDGTNLDFTTNNSTGLFPTTGWAGGSCGSGRLVQGINGRAGSYIDAAGRVCDRLVAGTEVADSVASQFGDEDGGSAFSSMCGEHGYVYGANVWVYENSVPVDQRYLGGIQLLCRK